MNALTGGIENEVFSIPGLVFPREDLIPRHGLQPRDVHRSGFQPLSVFFVVRTPDLDLHGGHSIPQGHIDPSISGELKRIDRIRYHGPSQAEIIFGDGVPYAVSRIVHRPDQQAGVLESLLD